MYLSLMEAASDPFKLMRFVVPLILSGLMCACGQPNVGGHTSQVAARVNGDEITVSQLNYVLSRLGVSNQDEAKRAQHKALESLIETDLLAKQALQQGLDREPQVLQAIQYSKKKILAQAYLDRVLAHKNLTSPTNPQVRKYYNKHPELFAKRRIYHMREISIHDSSNADKSVRAELAKATSFTQLSKWLDAHNISFTTQDHISAAENLPLGLLPKLDRLRSGDMVDISDDTQLRAIEMLSSDEQPLSKAEAEPLIKRFLANRQRMDLARTEVKRLRTSAKIELVGSFNKTARDAHSELSSAAASPSASNSNKTDYMGKGLSGLN